MLNAPRNVIVTYTITMLIEPDNGCSPDTLVRALRSVAKIVVDAAGLEDWTDSWNVHSQLAVQAPPLPEVKP